MKILCTADIHIGRRSSRLPPHLDAHAHSSAEAWRRIVERAVTDRVDVVAIAGDLIDHSNRYFEAIGVVESGLRRLAEAGITTVMVAGNHDFDVLPAIVDSIGAEHVRLLGRGGRWERMTVAIGTGRLHVDGWSFARPHVLESPLSEYAPEVDGTPTLALLHADLDQPGSRYAPIALPELRRHPESYFLLGHVHTPRLLEEPGGCRMLYPGSPQALDPGEVGAHGAHLLEVGPGGWTCRPLFLSTVRYEPLAVDVEGAGDAEEVEQRIYGEIRRSLASIAEAPGAATCVRYRLRLVGRSGIQKEIDARLQEFAADLELSSGSVSGTIESWSMDVSPLHDLGALMGSIGAPSILAEILQGKETATDVVERLRGDLRRMVAEVHGSRSFVEIAGGAADVESLQCLGEEELFRAAHLLLDELMLQKEARP